MLAEQYIWCSVVCDLPVLPATFCFMTWNNELYLYLWPKHPTPDSSLIVRLREPCCFIHDLWCVPQGSCSGQFSVIATKEDIALHLYFVDFELRYQRISTQIRRFCASHVSDTFETLNLYSIYLRTACTVLSLKCWFDSLSTILMFLHFGLGIEKKGGGSIARYISY
jgi:hypothetical protein